MSSTMEGFTTSVELYSPESISAPELPPRAQNPRLTGEQILSFLTRPEYLGIRKDRQGWTIERRGVDPADELRIEKQFTLGNGILTRTQRLDGPSLIYVKGLFEPMELPKPPGIDRNEQSRVPSLLALPDFWAHELRGENGALQFDEDTLVRTHDLEHGILTMTGTARDPKGRETEVSVAQFLDSQQPHAALMKVAVTPHYDGPLAIESGIDARTQSRQDHFKQTNSYNLGDDRGILLSAETRHGHHIAMTQQLHLVKDENHHPETGVIRTPFHETDKGVWQGIEVDAKAGSTYEFMVAASVHTEVDKELLEGQVIHPNSLAYLDTATVPDFDERLSRHMLDWERKWHDSEIAIDGDPELELALRFNLGHLLADVQAGYRWGGIGAKIGNAEGEGYGGRSFWDTDIFILPSLPKELRRTQLDYRYEQLLAARLKAKRAGYEGAWFPWEGHLAIPEEAESGEGCPEYIYNNVNRLVPVKTLKEAVHISADVTYAAMSYYEETHDEESLRNRDAEMILESARFLVSRAQRRPDGTYVYEHVTGPDEYHEDVTNNAYTLLMSAYAIGAAEELVMNGKVSQELSEKIGLTAAELHHWRHVREQLTIPFNPDTLLFSAFEGWESMQHVDLTSDAYRGVTEMDARLLEENPPPADKSNEELTDAERNPVSQTDVIKQHDTMLAVVLLGPKILNLLPRETVAALRERFGSDQQVMDAIYKSNYDEYVRQTSDGSSLSPSTGILAALAAGKNPDDCFAIYERLALMDLSEQNTHKTQNGLHTANAGASLIVMTEGFMGIKTTGDALVINPRLPSHLKSVTRAITSAGQDVTVRIDQQRGAVTVSRRRPAQHDLPLFVAGHEYTLRADQSTATFALEPAAQRERLTA